MAKEVISEAEERFEHGRKLFGLVVGPLAFLALLLFPPAGLSLQAANLAAVLVLALIWWMCEPIPIPVTALLAPALCVALGVGDARSLLTGFADPIVFLFIGSFILARAMMRHQLDRRFALSLLSIRWIGNSTRRVLLAFGVIAAFLSMWLSNTATTAMLLPIGLGILGEVGALMERQTGQTVNIRDLRFSTGLMLMLAYAASVGGLATPIGTPPNLIGIGMIREATGHQITFLHWMQFGVPVVVIMLIALFFLILFLHPPELRRLEGLSDYLRHRRDDLGRMTRGQSNTLLAFGLAVLLWVAPGILALVDARMGTRHAATFSKLLPEGIVAILAATLLFLLPVNWKEREFTLTWEEAAKIDWGTILLFGSGITLGSLAFSTGLSSKLGDMLLTMTNIQSPGAILFLSIALGIIISEATSNTASATMVIPVSLGVARQAGLDPMIAGVGACMGASYGFMLPVSTAPNAIVYGTGMVPILKMARAGILFDLIGLVIIWGSLMLMGRLL